MGIELVYNGLTKKWELMGCGFLWQFDTEEKAKSRKGDAWKEHNKRLEARNIMCNMLVQYRYV